MGSSAVLWRSPAMSWGLPPALELGKAMEAAQELESLLANSVAPTDPVLPTVSALSTWAAAPDWLPPGSHLLSYKPTRRGVQGAVAAAGERRKGLSCGLQRRGASVAAASLAYQRFAGMSAASRSCPATALGGPPALQGPPARRRC